MRGKRRGRTAAVHGERIIPAHAGQTPTGRREKHAASGSSPRMRGKPLAAPGHMALARIIPAHAGQTSGRPRCAYHETDHPRACGANRISLSTALRKPGSSPRMRGKRSCRCEICRRPRIIPAHAGQTHAADHAACSRPDHPRACGANFCSVFFVASFVGSSPRMRGKQGRAARRGLVERIIPAHAGQTFCSVFLLLLSSDHPRACGANSVIPHGVPAAVGSSPRMRGKRPLGLQGDAHHRIIPAHAGQTILVTHVRVHAADHPRACGANYCSAISANHVPGSSPRMRGKRSSWRHPPTPMRIIPAHAGQTRG